MSADWGCDGVAVVVPAHNAGGTIGATLASALGQPGVAELVVIDDGSNDDTGAVARDLAAAGGLRVLTGPNRGVSAARNRGIAETSAPWLLFLDADDVLVARSVARRLLVARETAADVIVCDWRDILGATAETASAVGPRRTIDWAAMARGAPVATATHVWAPPAALLYRRALVERIGGFREDLPIIQDARLLFDAAFHGGRFAHADHVGACYRVSAASLSRRDPAAFWADVLTNGRQIEALWRSSGGLTVAQRGAVAEIYDVAARGLLEAGHGGYFEAMAALGALAGDGPPRGGLPDWLVRGLGVANVGRLLRSGRRVRALVRP